MQQVEQYIAGERDYTMIKGDTGPLVYPAGHVYIYRALYELTEQGTNILAAQLIFAAVYLVNEALAMWCYWEAEAPPYLLPLLILSKRLHSIYILRLFNDCFSVTGLFLTILLFQKRQWTYGALVFSLGLSVKMSLLLALPAIMFASSPMASANPADDVSTFAPVNASTSFSADARVKLTVTAPLSSPENPMRRSPACAASFAPVAEEPVNIR